MVEISLSGSGEGPGWATAPGYSTAGFLSENGIYVNSGRANGLFTEEELQRTQRAWEVWSRSPDSFLAFSWCRVVGRKPGRCRTTSRCT